MLFWKRKNEFGDAKNVKTYLLNENWSMKISDSNKSRFWRRYEAESDLQSWHKSDSNVPEHKNWRRYSAHKPSLPHCSASHHLWVVPKSSSTSKISSKIFFYDLKIRFPALLNDFVY